MKNIAKLLLIYCIIAIIGYDAKAQDNPPKDENSELNRFMDELRKDRSFSESQEKDFLRNREISRWWANNLKHPEDNNVQLQYTVRMNRPGKYKLGEPIFIRGYVKNLSDYVVMITVAPSRSLFSTDRVTLVDAVGNEVPMTRTGRQEDECIKNDGKDTVSSKDALQLVFRQCEKDLKPGPIVLNQYFDLTRPGVYHLTFHRLSFDKRKQLDKPLTSNTLTFEVLDEAITPDDLRDPGEFKPPQEEPSVK